MELKKLAIGAGIMLMVFVPLSAQAITSNIAGIVFTTDPRSVDPELLSEAMTIQVQNASGSEEKLDSTADVTFNSSSATGEFLGSTGKTVTKTMNSGSANKTFYYRDTTAGAHIITVVVTPRTGAAGWTAEQTIYVGVSAPQDSSSEESEEDEGSGNDNSASESSHASAAKIVGFKKTPELKVGAGRNRTALVHTPLYFEAEVSQGSKKVEPKIEYKWSFGDGDSAVGKKIDHTYYFHGEYNVVLTARHRDQIAVSRIKVKVIDNAVAIASTSPGINGFVELRNNSATEVNVNGWEVKSGKREYVLSVDTIINPKSSIRIPNRVLSFDPGNSIELIFPTNEVAQVYIPGKEEEKAVQVASAPKPIIQKAELIEVAEMVIPQEEEKKNYATTVQAAAVAAEEGGWWSFIKSFFSIK
jgi:hypothetical protein